MCERRDTDRESTLCVEILAITMPLARMLVDGPQDFTPSV